VLGYTLNQQRLEAQQEKMDELRQAIALSARLIHNKNLSPDESRGILTILEKYSHALTVLDDYDHQRLQVSGTRTLAHEKIAYDERFGRYFCGANRRIWAGCLAMRRTILSRVR
jgi:hypothetical protein